MNILVPDSWLREYLETKATPSQIKEYLSLCGPSVERIIRQGKEIIYDIEVTSNRPDMMSISGIAREAAVILPRFGIKAKFINDPYKITETEIKFPQKNKYKLKILSDPKLNPRWTSVIIENVKVGKSPKWLKQKLELTGIRSLNNVIDVTNYLMRAYGQPAHAFDFDEILSHKDIPTMVLRQSKKGERLITLDKQTHTLPGGDIVIEDGSGRIIDLCGIMGCLNSSIKPTTKRVLLFMQTYNPQKIRQTMMKLSFRTEAGSLFEKDIDTELVLPTVISGIELMTQLTGGQIASNLYDIYPHKFKPYKVICERKKLDVYIGSKLSDEDIFQILKSLRFENRINADYIEITIPSFRRDVQIDVDIIEEISRIYGYHKIIPQLPQTVISNTDLDPILHWEQDLKIRLRDWGYTETYTYSMISKNLMDLFNLPKNKSYKIVNPLSNEWVYLRPSMLPSMLNIASQNLKIKSEFEIFELSHIYLYKSNSLPVEKSILMVLWTGDKFRQAKGLAETIFSLFTIQFPNKIQASINIWWDKYKSLQLGDFGQLGLINSEVLAKLNINVPVTILEIDFDKLVSHINIQKTYVPIPKYPPIIEDLTFILKPHTGIGNIISEIYKSSDIIYRVQYLNSYQDSVTFKIYYLNAKKSLSSFDIEPVRLKLIKNIEQKFNAVLKGNI